MHCLLGMGVQRVLPRPLRLWPSGVGALLARRGRAARAAASPSTVAIQRHRCTPCSAWACSARGCLALYGCGPATSVLSLLGVGVQRMRLPRPLRLRPNDVAALLARRGRVARAVASPSTVPAQRRRCTPCSAWASVQYSFCHVCRNCALRYTIAFICLCGAFAMRRLLLE